MTSAAMLVAFQAYAADWRHGSFVFIANNHLYQSRADGKGKVVDLLGPSEFGDSRSTTLNGLVCGHENDVLFFVTTFNFSGPSEKPKTDIFAYEPRSKRLRRFSPALSWPALSDDGRRLAALDLGYGSPDALIIRDLQTESVKRFAIEKVGPPRSWGPGDREVFATGLDEKGKSWRVIAIDTVTGKSRTVASGGLPVTNNSIGRLAYVSANQKSLIVSDLSVGTAIGEFRGFFKDLGQWLDHETILFVSGVGYNDYLGIANLKSKTTTVVLRPASGEIRGVCWAREY